MTPYIRLHRELLQRFSSGEGIDLLAKEFDLDPAEVERMLQVGLELLLHPRSKSQLKKLLNKCARGTTSSMKYKNIVRAAIYAHLHEYSLPEWVYEEYRLISKQLVSQSLAYWE